ncbi:inorganic phosphate transporter [Phocaeicola coprocola]|uniref:inorganic phosphate transporter n=1 Tax=Phocaeicola coprocola TaxID=310298 RepID=UPI001C382D34|nr:inorganic phosphate transporter [Phocaeicola coprocola]MBV3867214.1 inorganic phosphate transporter [Phocaeicola coprocola]MBV4008364.1 inorganic phosphate transporter [Phocaeicola coprocola]MBV4032860.1 inorganic phosphate transporter [Phocaeicola coprocola]MBV4039443.1 inorganic phosphate transporter [Phocaeicola coprocola]MBV4061073.1 inorganic phosphate transporter [Phocaeicola coprocola]
METLYLGIVIFLFMLAIFDLLVGVSNDAVNFMNSAVGAKVARYKTIVIVAAVGVFVGAIMSNGMMDIARHGIFQPANFSFYEIMCILLAVMVTDVVLLDVFNTLGLPTSTTVSMVFELLGGTFILAILKIIGDETGLLSLGDMMNTEKALSVIMGIFLSVAIAFIAGTIVQYISRLIFSFNYKKHLSWTIGVFGGISVTALAYFVLIKGLKSAPFMSAESLAWIDENTTMLVVACFVFFTVLMQILHWCKVNVFRIIVLLGTFSLALAFAGNDLVNFIGVPLAGFSAYTDYAANSNGVGIHDFMMNSLMSSAKTPAIFLLASGIIMVYALATSKKAKNVIKTSVDLARQEEGDEMFGSSALARTIVRRATTINEFMVKVIPVGMRRWIDSRFNKDEVILENGAAFDMVRAAVNLVLSGLLIIIGTTMKLPLSTTYVTFIVAMGSSLADRAWGRESAVYRITGMLSVIGGWFITAFVAFTICALVTAIMFYTSFVGMFIFICVAVFLLVRSNIKYSKKEKAEQQDDTFKRMMASKDKAEVLSLLRLHVKETLTDYINYTEQAYMQVTDGFINEDLKQLKKVMSSTDDQKKMLKKRRRKEILGLRRIPIPIAIEKNTWFHLGSNSCEQMLYCLKRICEPCKEHVDNNFNPISKDCIAEFLPIREELCQLMDRTQTVIENNNYAEADDILVKGDALKNKISALRKQQMNRMQEADSTSLKASMVYLNILQESQELVSIWRHLLRASRFFQGDYVPQEAQMLSLTE